MKKHTMQRSKLTQEIHSILEKRSNSSFVIVIDGDCASGKSTYAHELSLLLDANLIHMDDFYLPFSKRSESASGHMDVQRCIDTVLKPYRDGCDLDFYKYNPHSDQIVENYYLKHHPILIIEGSYSFHPLLRDYIDLSIIFKIDENTQKERIIQRSSEEVYERFRSMWIPKEKNYQKESKCLELCDLIVYP